MDGLRDENGNRPSISSSSIWTPLNQVMGDPRADLPRRPLIRRFPLTEEGAIRGIETVLEAIDVLHLRRCIIIPWVRSLLGDQVEAYFRLVELYNYAHYDTPDVPGVLPCLCLSCINREHQHLITIKRCILIRQIRQREQDVRNAICIGQEHNYSTKRNDAVQVGGADKIQSKKGDTVKAKKGDTVKAKKGDTVKAKRGDKVKAKRGDTYKVNKEHNYSAKKDDDKIQSKRGDTVKAKKGDNVKAKRGDNYQVNLEHNYSVKKNDDGKVGKANKIQSKRGNKAQAKRGDN